MYLPSKSSAGCFAAAPSTCHVGPVSMECELQTQWVQCLANLHTGLQFEEVVGDHSSTLKNL